MRMSVAHVHVSVARAISPGSGPALETATPSGVHIADRPAVRAKPPPVGPAKLATATQTP